LQRLAALQGRPGAEQIRYIAAEALKQRYPWQPIPAVDSKAVIAKLPLYPAGRALDPQLSQRLAADWSRFNPLVNAANVTWTTAGVFIDLDGDGTDEFVLLSAGGGPVYQNRGDHWEYVGRLFPDGKMANWPLLAKGLAVGHVTAVAPPWKELTVGANRYRMFPQPY
jgi:hypothetical protein